ncbi:MAG: efflux RND transporter permease subunit [Candidatus Omnitrophica bacterium]|nr:efflux RND transporter permease subunit [Candidatus Omnitrophota bacterium]
MLEKLIQYFVKRPLLTNLIFLTVIIGGVLSWRSIKKEEMPDVTFDRVRISATYPGATAEEVEHFVIKPIEDEIQGLDGIDRVTSSASEGQTDITVEIEKNYPDKDEVITEIRNAVLDVDQPDDVRDDPTVRVFKTAYGYKHIPLLRKHPCDQLNNGKVPTGFPGFPADRRECVRPCHPAAG